MYNPDNYQYTNNQIHQNLPVYTNEYASEEFINENFQTRSIFYLIFSELAYLILILVCYCFYYYI